MSNKSLQRLAMQRLASFAKWPLSRDVVGFPNFAFKAAEAFFERSSDCLNNEVMCTSCGIRINVTVFGRLSPVAVHRVISPRCPALNPSPHSQDTSGDSSFCRQVEQLELEGNVWAKYLPDRTRHRLQLEARQAGCRTPELPPYPDQMVAADRVRRVLFQDEDPSVCWDVDNGDSACLQQAADLPDHNDSDSGIELDNSDAVSRSQSQPTNTSSLLDQPPITHPFVPKCGDFNKLFTSERLQTFPQPRTSQKYIKWAEEGFIYRTEHQDLMCVFCGAVIVLNGHQPSVIHKKVSALCPFVMGFDTGNITLQQERDIRRNYLDQQTEKRQCGFDSELVNKYPEYQEETDRQETFLNWPKVWERTFPSGERVLAGFFYSGCGDKVKCYSCGVELYDWSEEADVWKTHAAVSPTCPHVARHKGPDFITQAANTQILAEVKYYKDCNKGSVSSSGGVVEAEPGSVNLDTTAVKAALACRYPNEAILKASLKAADENHITICKQQQVVLEQGTQLQHKDTQLQEQGAQLQQQGAQLQQQGAQLQQVFQEKEQVLQEKQQVLQLADSFEEQLQVKNGQLQVKNEQLREKTEEVRHQEEQIRSLMQQVHQLRADRANDRRLPAPEPQGDGAQDGEGLLACKICMADKPRMYFFPCGHIFSCAECTSRLPDKRCPVCRQVISREMPAFVA